MEGPCVYEEKIAIHELTQGIQMAKQLRLNLHSPEARNFFIKKILSSYDNALFILRSGNFAGQPAVGCPTLPAPTLPESLISIGSPRSEDFEFNQPFSIQQGQNVSSKKRKGSTTWDNQVTICSGNELLEENTDDGYNRRKYGQKDISGAKFPRSYYRCPYRKVQKCLATKQVQRTDEDPTMFDNAYKGKHTCNDGAQSASPPPPPPPLSEKHEITPTHHRRQLSPPSSDEMLSNLGATLSVDTSDFGGDIVRSSFSFPSKSSGLVEDHHQFSFPSTSSGLMEDLDQFHLQNHYDDELWGSSSSLDFLAVPADADPDFELLNSFF